MTATEIATQQQNSYLASIGRFFEPVVEPLGFNWKGSVALISGATAKEIVVSTLGVLYSNDNDSAESLSQRIAKVNPETGTPDFTPLVRSQFYGVCRAIFPMHCNNSGNFARGRRMEIRSNYNPATTQLSLGFSHL